jgi:hypothetical protein
MGVKCKKAPVDKRCDNNITPSRDHSTARVYLLDTLSDHRSEAQVDLDTYCRLLLWSCGVRVCYTVLYILY